MKRDKIRKIAKCLEDKFAWDITFSKKVCPRDDCYHTTTSIRKKYCPLHGIELEVENDKEGLDQLQEAIEYYE